MSIFGRKQMKRQQMTGYRAEKYFDDLVSTPRNRKMKKKKNDRTFVLIALSYTDHLISPENSYTICEQFECVIARATTLRDY